MTVFVVVAVHNRCAFTKQFLESVREQDCSESIEIVVVDDGSSDQTAELLREQEDLIVLKGSGNLWWAGAVRLGLQRVRDFAGSNDWVYLGNNDTVLEVNHIAELLESSEANAVVGSVANEIWPDGTVNPVSAAFQINADDLVVRNLPVGSRGPIHALAGRGLLLPTRAADPELFKPSRMPQHFADLAFTASLKRRGWNLRIADGAISTQLERAGSSVEFAPRLRDVTSKRSQMYLPALWNFWWELSSPNQRATLPLRFVRRGFQQLFSGAYR